MRHCDTECLSAMHCFLAVQSCCAVGPVATPICLLSKLRSLSHVKVKSAPRSNTVKAKRAEAGFAAPAAPSRQKTLYLMRHGQTEMNAFLHANPGGYDDPMMFDTILSDTGRQQARIAAPQAAKLSPQPELLVSSPLTRCADLNQPQQFVCGRTSASCL